VLVVSTSVVTIVLTVKTLKAPKTGFGHHLHEGNLVADRGVPPPEGGAVQLSTGNRNNIRALDQVVLKAIGKFAMNLRHSLVSWNFPRFGREQGVRLAVNCRSTG